MMNHFRKPLSFLLVVILMLTCIASVTVAEELPRPEKKEKYTFYFSQRAMNHPWMVAMTESFQAAAETYADRVESFTWTDGNDDDADQLKDIEDMLQTKPDVMFLSAQTFESLAVVADMCRENGTVLIAVDRRINAIPGVDYAFWVGGDYADEGRRAAEEIVAKLYETKGEYKGNIVEITGTPGASAAIDRAAGFAAVLEQYPDINIITSQDGNFSRETAMNVMENILQKYPAGEIDGVFTHNDEMAIGIVEAIEKAGRDELFGWIVSVDGQVDGIANVIAGKSLATVQCPAGYGELCFEMALDYLDGNEVEAETYIAFETFSNRTDELL